MITYRIFNPTGRIASFRKGSPNIANITDAEKTEISNILENAEFAGHKAEIEQLLSINPG